jgi:hypothetical protein
VARTTHIPEGLCLCGCGQHAAIAKQTYKAEAVIKGQHRRYVLGHHGRRDVAVRLFAKVQKTDGCWLWQGSATADGYGEIWRDGRLERVHRVAYELLVGPIPDGLFILHSCDTPNCVNPSHLEPGTNSKNLQDAAARRRFMQQRHPEKYQGENSGNAKITRAIVREIRSLAAAGETFTAIAPRFNLARTTVGKIVNRKLWAHVTD